MRALFLVAIFLYCSNTLGVIVFYDDFSEPTTDWHKYEGSSFATSTFDVVSTAQGNALQISITSLSQSSSWSMVGNTIESFNLPNVGLDNLQLIVNCEANIPGNRQVFFHLWSYGSAGITGKLDFSKVTTAGSFTLGGLLSKGTGGGFLSDSDQFFLGIRFGGPSSIPKENYWLRIHDIILETVPEPSVIFLLTISIPLFVCQIGRTRRCS